MSRNEPLKVRIYLCFWSFNEKNDFHRNRYRKTVWGKGGEGEIGLKVLQVIAITGSADEIGLQSKEGGSRLKKSKCNVAVLKEKLLVKKKKGQCDFKRQVCGAERTAPGAAGAGAARNEVSDLYDKQHTVSQSAHSISVSKWNIDWKWPWNRMH